MATYQPEIIQTFANRLYARAAVTTVTSALLGILIGLVVTPHLFQVLPSFIVLRCPEWVVPVILGLMGLGQGLERASVLKLQAQTALCQLQIEVNTRLIRESGSGASQKP